MSSLFLKLVLYSLSGMMLLSNAPKYCVVSIEGVRRKWMETMEEEEKVVVVEEEVEEEERQEKE